MSRTCDLCGKKATRANHVSHSNRKVTKLQKPNLQLIKVEGESAKACTTCRRTLVKQK